MSGFCGYTTPVSGKAAGSLVSSLQDDPDKSKLLAAIKSFTRWKVVCGIIFRFTLYVCKTSSPINLYV